jgi:predicted O-methyltransferase YrrM
MDLDSLNAMGRGFQESRVLFTAIELDIFTAVGQGSTAAQVAARCHADPRAAEMLLNVLAACELLTKQGDVFRNTALSAEHLAGPARMAWMHMVHLWESWSTLTDAVRKGTTTLDPNFGSRTGEWTEAFIAAMHRNAAERAPRVVQAVGTAGVRRMLDVGGGSGAYSIAFAQAAPGLQADLVDQEPVTRIARRHIAEAGLTGRVQLRVGDLRNGALGQGYDLVLLSAICHMLGEEENRDLILRCAAACAPGGRVVIQDFILNDAKTAPKFAAMFSLNMLVGTARGSDYSESEYAQWMQAAGLGGVRRVPMPPPADLMIGTASS